MSHAAAKPEDDFNEQLSALVIEAGTKIAPSPASKKSAVHPAPAEEHRHVDTNQPPAWAKPLIQGIESLSNAHNENARRLDRIEKALTGGSQVSQILTECRQSLDQRNVVNRVMFEALHTELKGYKDVFMLEAVLRPIIRDLMASGVEPDGEAPRRKSDSYESMDGFGPRTLKMVSHWAPLKDGEGNVRWVVAVLAPAST